MADPTYNLNGGFIGGAEKAAPLQEWHLKVNDNGKDSPTFSGYFSPPSITCAPPG